MNNESKEGDISLKKPWIKRKKKQNENELLTEQSVQVEQSQMGEELQEEAEFTSFCGCHEANAEKIGCPCDERL